MNKLFVIIVLCAGLLYSQVPDAAYNPMTANGAKGISTSNHILYWQNPSGVTYNEVYFSSDSLLVFNSDASVRVKNGSPSTVFNSYSVSEYGQLTESKYFWKVVEYNSNGASVSPVWYFYRFEIMYYNYEYTFNNNLDGWQAIGPLGQNNWSWSNTNQAGGSSGEIRFSWDPLFNGYSYIISPELIVQDGGWAEINFKYFEDWWSDTVTVGCAYTTNSGTDWNSIWELNATTNMGPENVIIPMETPEKIQLGFYYKGNSNNIDFFIIDDVSVNPVIPLSPSLPPSMLTAVASENELKVTLNWNDGWAPDGMVGYELQRKLGLPESNNPYVKIAETDLITHSFEDTNVNLDEIYTYRIKLIAMGNNSIYGNEATAYVPDYVPVELLSFTASVINNDLTLNWTTATETNNSGFQIERSKKLDARSEAWQSIEFVSGNGTTTKPHIYSYTDKNLSAGKYLYRLKQIDFDGTFEYSKTVEAEISSPNEFVLEQNYPNPFNPSTKIRYSIPTPPSSSPLIKERNEVGFVTLKVYDILGNEVATLVNEQKPAGTYEVEFNLASSNKHLASGTYFYQLKASSFLETKKMVYLK
ncbi:MAG: T9SS type A sorting domain-containing protein [Ignavibacteriaceae bacterium]|jgi:hypothetical protein|nr:T9SS type A sorting domain-containing protein [Ignavibacteriaceae bacterium]